jgi:hypothetical protein
MTITPGFLDSQRKNNTILISGFEVRVKHIINENTARFYERCDEDRDDVRYYVAKRRSRRHHPILLVFTATLKKY